VQHWSKTIIRGAILGAVLVACPIALAGCGGKQTTPQNNLENKGDDGVLQADGPSSEYKGDPSKGALEVACNFDDGWVAVIPRDVYGDTQDEFVMQALIGFAVEPGFWNTLAEYKKFAPYAAQKCGAKGTLKELEPGQYVMLVGWANQFEKTGYKNNGRIETITIEAAKKIEKRISTSDLDQDMPCISCPFLLIKQDGEFVELGQILIDRYIASKQGTDARETRAQVENGLITVMLAEREPEVSYIDAIEVWYQGKPLRPHAGVPSALHAVDGAMHILRMGDSVTAMFHAPIENGSLPVEIRVNGYYILDRGR
jgi:hypothetical protein